MRPSMGKAGGRVRAGLAAVGWGAGIALVAALAAAWSVVAAERYWDAGYYRLVAWAVAAHFDRFLLPCVGMVAVASTVASRWRIVPGDATPGRRRWRAIGGLFLVATVTLRAAVAVDAIRGRRGPSILLISIDTLRADRLGTYGHREPTTPVIDGMLAAAGTVFERCISQSPKTTPSHMTMLTGLYPCVHGVTLWEGAAPGPVLSPAVHTLAEVLRNAGYATGAFTGRGHVHRSRGFGQGFDVYMHARRYENSLPTERADHVESALRWMEAQHGRKFFLFFHTYAVHDPYIPPASAATLFDDPGYDGPVRDAVVRLRNDRRAWNDAHRIFWNSVDRDNAADVAYVERLYDAAIHYVDRDVVGRLLARLESLGIADDTLVVLTSDHGEAFGEHGRFLHGDLFIETLHVPLILRFPGRVPAGLRVAAPVRLLDLMPTVLDLVGVGSPPRIQGRSLVCDLQDGAVSGGSRGSVGTAREPGGAGACQGPAGSGATPPFPTWSPVTGFCGDDTPAAALPAVPVDPVLSELAISGDGQRVESLRRGDLTYITEGGREWLYDQRIDPGEQRDVAGERGEDVTAMRQALARWRGECEELGLDLGPRGDGVRPSRETVEQLRALGYVR